MSFISITGAIKWDIFVFYIVSGLIFVTCICVIGEITMVVKGEVLVPTLEISRGKTYFLQLFSKEVDPFRKSRFVPLH